MFKKLIELGIFSIQNAIKLLVLAGSIGAAWAGFVHRIDTIEQATVENKENIEQNSTVNSKILNIVCALSIDLANNKEIIKKNCER